MLLTIFSTAYAAVQFPQVYPTQPQFNPCCSHSLLSDNFRRSQKKSSCGRERRKQCFRRRRASRSRSILLPKISHRILLRELLSQHAAVQLVGEVRALTRASESRIAVVVMPFFFPSQLCSQRQPTAMNTTTPQAWVKIVSAWICSLLYIWTLVAPLLFPHRFKSAHVPYMSPARAESPSPADSRPPGGYL